MTEAAITLLAFLSVGIFWLTPWMMPIAPGNPAGPGQVATILGQRSGKPTR